MDPQHQTPQVPSSEQNPYDFFMSAQEQKKRSKLAIPDDMSKTKRLLLLVGGGGTLLIVLLMVFSMLFGGNGRGNALLEIAQEQNELLRIADLTKNEPAARGTATQVLATNVRITVSSSNEAVLSLIKKSGTKVNDQKLALKKDSTIDRKLSDAAVNNTYENTFRNIMLTQLTQYQRTAKKVQPGAKSTQEKEALSDIINNTTLLIGNPTAD